MKNNKYLKFKTALVLMFLSSFSLIADASNGVESVNSYVEEKHSATNFNARKQELAVKGQALDTTLL